MPQSSDRRSIADRSWDVRQSLFDLLDRARTTQAPVESQQVEDVLDRFKLWTGNLGALHHAHKRISLESRLADSPEVQGQICEQLDDMQEAIQDLLTLCSETCLEFESNTQDEQDAPGSIDQPGDNLVPDMEQSSRESEASLILNMVSECLKALFRIGILVRKATPRDRFERALQQFDFAFAPQFDINYVQERYKKLASMDSRWLTTRLGAANAKRRQFINYARDHKAKLEVEHSDPAADAATMVQSSKATTFVVPGNLSASEFLQSPLEADEESVSLVSASTAFNNDTSLRLPSLADLGPDGEYFECPICFTLQSFRVEKSWKIHAYRDLKAYVCTSGGEECEHKMFDDRDSWFAHELEHHRALCLCKLCGYQHMDTKALQRHLLDEHGPYPNEKMHSIIEHGKLVPSQLRAQDCPFCDDWASILLNRRHQTQGQDPSSVHPADILVSLTHFKRHLATHQEQLAIFAVPRAVDNDGEHSHGAVEATSEAVSSKDEDSQIIEKEAHLMEESHPLHQTCVSLSGLPRAIREADIKNHFISNGFTGIREITPRLDDLVYIFFQDPDDVRRAIKTLDGSTLMGVRINPRLERLPWVLLDSRKGASHDVEQPHAENSQSFQAIDEIDSADSHFRTTLLPMCEEFIANPPADPQERQDQSTHIVTMIRQQVWSTVNFIDSGNDQEVTARKAEILETVGVMLDRVRAVAITNTRDAEIKTQDQNQGRVHQSPADRCRVKLYTLHDSDWQDQGTGYCTVNFVETANERREACISVNSEEEPDRLMLEEKVHQDDNFQLQQETLIVWTQRQTGIDLALSFQDAAGAFTIWKIIDTVQRNVNVEMRTPVTKPTDEVSKGFIPQVMPRLFKYIDREMLANELDRILGPGRWAPAKEPPTRDPFRVLVERELTKTEFESILEKVKNHFESAVGNDNTDNRNPGSPPSPGPHDATAIQPDLPDDAEQSEFLDDGAELVWDRNVTDNAPVPDAASLTSDLVDEFCPKLDEVLIRAVADDYDLSNQFEAVRAILKDLEDAEVEGAPHFNTGRVDGDTDRDDGR